MSDMERDIQELIDVKNFEELTSEERAYVLKEMTEDDYRAQRAVVLFSEEMFQKEAMHMKANPSTKKSVLGAFEEKYGKKKDKGKLLFLFTYKVPAWATAAAVVAAIFLSSFFVLNGLEIEQSAIPQQQVADTVYMERVITEKVEVPVKSDTIVKVVYIKDNINTHATNNNSSPTSPRYTQEELDILTGVDGYSVDYTYPDKKKGISLKEDPVAQMVLGM